MTDKVQKIKEWISNEQDGLMDAQGNFEYPEHEGAYHILCNLDAYIDSLQEEPCNSCQGFNDKDKCDELVFTHNCPIVKNPVSIWHDASEEPNDIGSCLIFYGCKESVGHYLHYEPVLYNKREKMFVTSSFPHPTGYKVEQKSFDGGCVAEVYKDRRDRISISDITQWCYLCDLHKLSNIEKTEKNEKKESVSEELEAEINYLSKRYPEVSFAKLSRIAVHVANWQKQQTLENKILALGDDLRKVSLEWDMKVNFQLFNMVMNENQPIGIEQSTTSHAESFIAGANWQKKQDQETIELAEDHAMLAGIIKGTEHTIGNVRSILNKVAYRNNGLDVNGDYCEQPYVELDNEFKKLLKEG